MPTMNERVLPLWLKRCLLCEMIAKVFEISFDVCEKIMRNLSSCEQKNSHMMITELKSEIDKYDRKEHIVFMKDENVWFDDPFYDVSIGRGCEWPSSCARPNRRLSRPLRPLPEGFCPRAFCESFLPRGLPKRLYDRRGKIPHQMVRENHKIYNMLVENELGEQLLGSGRNIYNMNIGRFLSLYRCELDFTNFKMIKVCYAEEFCNNHPDIKLGAGIFCESVDAPIRVSRACMSYDQRKELFYQNSEGLMVEHEAEYYLYLIKSSLLKALPLRELHK